METWSSTTSWSPSRRARDCWGSPRSWPDLIRGKRIDSEGWAGFFGVTGLLLLVLGLHTTVTWPFGGDGFEYANIAFGQPAAGFGALLLFAAVYLWRHRALFAGDVGRRPTRPPSRR